MPNSSNVVMCSEHWQERQPCAICDPELVKCQFHGVVELTAGTYLRCPECYHVYTTEKELLDLFNKQRVKAREILEEVFERVTVAHLTAVAQADKVSFCPLCLHDLT